jgi:hypothetical protein
MCRIASLYLLQRLKGITSGDPRNFNNIDIRAVNFYPARQGAERNSRHSDRNIRITCAISTTVKNWVTQINRGDFSTCNAPRPGRPKTLTNQEIIDHIQELILEDRCISPKSIADQLAISHERVGPIILEDLDMRKLSTK